jgi:hypothetical protein
MLQGIAFQQFHNDERAAIVVSNFMNRADVRMIDGRRGSGFALEPLQRDGIPRQIIRQKLQRNFASQLEILGAIHQAHTACAELRHDLVMPNGLAQHGSDSALRCF